MCTQGRKRDMGACVWGGVMKVQALGSDIGRGGQAHRCSVHIGCQVDFLIQISTMLALLIRAVVLWCPRPLRSRGQSVPCEGVCSIVAFLRGRTWCALMGNNAAGIAPLCSPCPASAACPHGSARLLDCFANAQSLESQRIVPERSQGCPPPHVNVFWR